MDSIDANRMQCKLKNRCPHGADPLHNCWDPECNGWMHKKCSEMLLARHDVPVEDRPTESDANELEEPIVFCKKGCYTKWASKKKKEAKAAAAAAKAAQQPPKKPRKVPWEEDGTLDILLEWLTTEGNYADYCGGSGNNGKTKTQHHKELAILIKEKQPLSERTEKDVENKISGLERQFRVASDWANNTGQGVDKPGDFEAAIAKRCPHYAVLEPVMGERPNAKPLATNEDADLGELLLDEDDDCSGMADFNP